MTSCQDNIHIVFYKLDYQDAVRVSKNDCTNTSPRLANSLFLNQHFQGLRVPGILHV